MIMRRIASEQVKLLLLGLLRTVSAIATSDAPKIIASSTTSSATTSTVTTFPHALANNNNHHHQVVQQNYNSHASLSPVVASAAAAATTASTSAILQNQQQQNQQQRPKQNQQRITLRLARRTDVPSIQRCNLSTLPENYNQQFYVNHLRQWPELVLVAECTDNTNDNPSTESEDTNKENTPPPRQFPTYSSFPTRSSTTSSSLERESNIVAYVIGKVEDRTVAPGQPMMGSSDEYDEYQDVDEYYNANFNFHAKAAANSLQSHYRTERVGHVTSLAVLEPYRRLGLAQTLMEQLHAHFQACYPSCTAIGLHVRQSNMAACKLYERLGYTADSAISCYYQDGEDAYFMKKVLDRSNAKVFSQWNNPQQQRAAQVAQQDQRATEYPPTDPGMAGRFFFRNNLFRPWGSSSSSSSQSSSSSPQGATGGDASSTHSNRIWEHGPPELQLPRIVATTPTAATASQQEEEALTVAASNAQEQESSSFPSSMSSERDHEEQDTPDLLTGTM